MKRLLVSACLAGLAISGGAVPSRAAESAAAETTPAKPGSSKSTTAKGGTAVLNIVPAVAKTGATKPVEVKTDAKTAAKSTAKPTAKTAAKTTTSKTTAKTTAARSADDEAQEAEAREAEAIEAVSTADAPPQPGDANAAAQTASAPDAAAPDAQATDGKAGDATATEKTAETKPKHMNTGHPQIDALVAVHAKANDVPEALIHRVIVRESKYQKDLVGHCGCIGLMQIKLGTARGLGYGGDAQGLHDPNTNLTYGVKYLAGAYRAARGDHDRAVHYFAKGYYDVAKQQRLADARAFGKPERVTGPLDITPKSANSKPSTSKTATVASAKHGGAAPLDRQATASR